MNRRTRIILLLLVLLLAATTRFYQIGAQSFWNDEGTSVALAQRDIPTITENAANDIHPPLYYYILHAWISVFGSSETGARSLSALLGVALVACLYALVRKLGRHQTALTAAALAAINPLLIYYGQETRMYELAAFLGTLSTLILVWLWKPESDASTNGLDLKKSVLWLFVTLLGVYSHYFVFAIVAAQNVAVLAWLLADRSKKGFRWKPLVHWASLQLLIIALYAPWLAFSWSSLSAWPSVSEPMNLFELTRRVFGVYSLGVTVPNSTAWTGLSLLATIPLILGLLFKELSSRSKSKRAHLLAASWAIVPILVMYGLSLRQPMYKSKFFIVAVPAYCWLQAMGIIHTTEWVKQRLTTKWLSWTLGLILMVCATAGPALSLHNLYWNADYARDDYRGIVEYIQAAATPDSAVLINAPAQVETFDLYYSAEQPVYPLPEERPLNPLATEQSLRQITEKHDRIYAVLWATDESDPDGLIESWLDQNLFKTMDSWFGNVRLAVYAVPDAPASSPQIRVNARVSNSIGLQGYAITPDRATSGDILQLTLFWECTQKMDTRYKTFVHLLDQQGSIISQRDSEPVGGSRPTDSWNPGEVITDNYGLLVPPASAPGKYSLRIGMYSPDTGERLPIELDGSTTDSLIFPTIDISLSEIPPPIEALGIPQKDVTDWDGLNIVGHGLYKLGFEHTQELDLHPGDPLKLEIYWQRSSGSIDTTWTLQFEQRNKSIWETEITVLGGTLSLTDWQEGYVLRDVHVIYPPALEPGQYTLTLAGSGGQHIELQNIRIQPIP